jgi:hypothetical protein
VDKFRGDGGENHVGKASPGVSNIRRPSICGACERVIFNEMSGNESVGELLITANGF